MQWSDRQRAMLEVMGVRVWVAPTQSRAAGWHRDEGDLAVARVDDASQRRDASLRDRLETSERVAPNPSSAPSHAAPESSERAASEAPTTPNEFAAADTRSRAERIATMDWTALRESAAACTACELHKGRTHSVFASAPGRADWLVVGDPPSADDDRDGVPISGDAGRLLDNMLLAARLSRASTALAPMKACATTIVKCRPPDDRAADPSEIAACAPYLQRQLELVQPKVVFAMGRCAAQGLVNRSEPIGKLRGSVHRWHGVPVVVTFHPCHLARHSADKAKAWDDLCKAVEVADHGLQGAAEPGSAPG